jgi:hypothetical protein
MSVLSVVKDALGMLDTLGKIPTGPETFTNAVNNIFQVISVILMTDGKEGWHQKVNEVMGQNVLNSRDEEQLQPIVTFILEIKNAKQDEPINDLLKPQQQNQLQQGGGNPEGIDGIYQKGIDYVKNIDKYVKDMANTYGIVQYVNKRDQMADMYPFRNNIDSLFLPWTKVLGLIPLPFRSFLFLVESVLHFIRLAVSVPGSDSPFLRKLLSVALASLELLQGDWKTSLMLFSGFFNSSLVYIGFVGTVFLEIFYMISPPLQDDIIFGTLRVTKSIIIGFLFKIFQITAIKPVRDEVMGVFKELSERETKLDKVLEEAGFEGRAQIKSPFNTTGFHGFLEDRAFNCSEEFRTIVDLAKKNIIVRIILQLVNIPTEDDDIETQCKRFTKSVDEKGYKTWAEILHQEGLMKLLPAEDQKNASDAKDSKDAAASAARNIGSSDAAVISAHPELAKELEELKKQFEEAFAKEDAAEKAMLDGIAQIAKKAIIP